MNKKILILLLAMISIVVEAQYREMASEEGYFLQQSDSVYSVNKVKSRTLYKVNYSFETKQNIKEKKLKFEMDKEGKIILIENEPYINGRTQTTYFIYNKSSLIEIIDTLRKGESKLLRLIKDVNNKKTEKLEKEIETLPEIERYNYKLNILNNLSTKITKYNQSGKNLRESSISNDGLIREYKDSDYLGETQYLKSANYKFIPIQSSHQLDVTSKPIIKTYEYQFDSKGFIIEMLIHEKYISDLFKLTYNVNNLLTKADSKYEHYIYEYEFYN
jgi:hypothetical protein